MNDPNASVGWLVALRCRALSLSPLPFFVGAPMVVVVVVVVDRRCRCLLHFFGAAVSCALRGDATWQARAAATAAAGSGLGPFAGLEAQAEAEVGRAEVGYYGGQR